VVGETTLTAQEEKHPADEIGKALSRAGGILSSLTNCYDRNETDFQISVGFMFEAVTAVEKLLGHASAELTKLYQAYDLTKLTDAQLGAEVEESLQTAFSAPELHEETEVDDEPLMFNRQAEPETSEDAQYLGFFGPSEQVSKLASRIDDILETMPTKVRTTSPDELFDRPALTYNELLEKLTAMADAAAYQAHQSPNDNQTLLPVLENLRADMLRIRSVA
jgi:ABC-type transporter Mla subunit MlaD